MPKIIYTSLVKLPKKVNSVKQALNLIYQFVDKPIELNSIESEIVLIDEWHINIVRYFNNVKEYQSWIFNKNRNESDKILIKNGFYLYTKQAHNE